ncbi:MAG: DUF1722 domain-containing protein [Nitrososphaeria archaeon]|nr:DUF1722 domain-containing protein [Nitrososphaeria archaeon]NIQ33406.1 DUF1722 domain-containing protein [Nitrososphaeria archaeon]
MKPRIVVSKCIEFEKVRYDGQIVSSDLVSMLKPYVEFIPVCPEVELGLGIPRDTLRLVLEKSELRLVQPKTNLDLTEKMQSFVNSFLDFLPEVDGFILKSRSPTSALRDVKIYSSPKMDARIISKGPGLFGREVILRFSNLAIEDEGRLLNPRIKEHFLTKLFTLANFREIKSKKITEIIDFHTRNKLLIKAYNQKESKILGKIVANEDRRPLSGLVRSYEHHLFEALKRPPKCGSNLNVMMNVMGYFSKALKKKEKSFFLDSLERYRQGILPLSILKNMLRLWLIRFEENYLLQQTFFEPYPKGLMDIDAFTTYCDGKDFWK